MWYPTKYLSAYSNIYIMQYRLGTHNEYYVDFVNITRYSVKCLVTNIYLLIRRARI